MNTQTIGLDLSKDGLGTNLLMVGQGDKGGTTIRALIYDGGAEAALSGYAAYLEVLLPNKANYYRAAATISGNVATVTLDESKLCSVPGYTDEAYFAFEKNGVRYSTERFAIEILKCVTAGKQPAKNWDNAVEDLISKAADAANRMSGALDSANRAVSTANDAASSANAAAVAASAAASGARVAAAHALDVANGITSSIPPSDELIAELKCANDVLATAVSELQDKYVIIAETAYAPADRQVGLSGETLILAKASMSTETATLD